MAKKSGKSDLVHLKVQVWIVVLGAVGGLKGLRGLRGMKVLLLKMRKDRGGFWQPVTGSVEKGESLRDGALREACEETGLSFASQLKSLGESFRFESRWGGTCEEHGFYLIASREAMPQVTLDPKEHTDYEWVSPTLAARRLGFASNRRMLRILRERLREKLN